MRKRSQRVGKPRHRLRSGLRAATVVAVLLLGVASMPEAWAYIRTVVAIPALESDVTGTAASAKHESAGAAVARDETVRDEPGRIRSRLSSERTSAHAGRAGRVTPHGPPRSFRPAPG